MTSSWYGCNVARGITAGYMLNLASVYCHCWLGRVTLQYWDMSTRQIIGYQGLMVFLFCISLVRLLYTSVRLFFSTHAPLNSFMWALM